MVETRHDTEEVKSSAKVCLSQVTSKMAFQIEYNQAEVH